MYNFNKTFLEILCLLLMTEYNVDGVFLFLTDLQRRRYVSIELGLEVSARSALIVYIPLQQSD